MKIWKNGNWVIFFLGLGKLGHFQRLLSLSLSLPPSYLLKKCQKNLVLCVCIIWGVYRFVSEHMAFAGGSSVCVAFGCHLPLFLSVAGGVENYWWTHIFLKLNFGRFQDFFFF